MKDSKSTAVYYRQIFFYLSKEKWLFILGLSALLLTIGSQLLPPLIIAHIIDKSIPQKDLADLIHYGIAFILVVVVSGLFSFAQTNFLARLGVKVITEFKRNVFSHLLKAPVSYFNTHSVGELIAKVESDSEAVKGLFSSTSIAIIGNILFFAGVYIVLLLKNSRITLLLTPPMILVAIVFFLLSRRLTSLFRKVRELYAAITARITDYVQGMLLIQVMNKQEKVYNTLFESSWQKRKADSSAFFTLYSTMNVFQFIFSVLFVILIIRLSTPGIIAGKSSIGTLFVFIQYISQLIYPMISLSFSFVEIQKAFVSLKRIMDLNDLETEAELHTGIRELQFGSEIVFENVWFAYQGTEWVLKDVSFRIPKGGKIGLVGPSGSGKSTIISLLCCFFEPQKGCIYVDGTPLKELDLFTWRKQIGLILQDIFLFPGNITENVRVYNDEVSETQVSQALDIVQLNGFIKNLAAGLNTELAERGQNISQGEKQLISFARALVFNPSIIVMDEATASIDMNTEARIQQAIQTLLSGKTSVIVAHRLSSILDADEILFFKQGRITHRGNHSQLLELCPEYRHLVELQQSSQNAASDSGEAV
jgi:ATP-binding cassette subfamily B protein